VPELDHTDEKYKNKQIIMEDAREEVCFKTGLAGFQITMMFYTLTKIMRESFVGAQGVFDWPRFDSTVDDNSGCLPMETEDAFQ
jgi:hypothetical protein